MRILSHYVRESARKMHVFVALCDRICDTRVRFKVATAVTPTARATSIPSEHVVRDKTPSFDLCQVDMYIITFALFV